ncbi:MAG: YdcF family protein [Treponema sp.]|jgi:uncharacterized SAM-binding protein YcdF (DUF218 family)|nr:YdcF family protein [Treponema sp.]
MIVLSKLFTVFILPPGCFIIVLLFLVIFLPRKKKFFPILVLLFLYLLSTQPVSDLLLKPLENAYPPLSPEFKKDWPQAIVILGNGTVIGSPEAGAAGQDTLTSDAMKRAVYAFSLRDTFDVPFVFSGGKVFEYNQESEALTAGRLFVSLGLPFERLIMETASRNTWENARETAKLGIEKAVLVTSAYHVKRSVYCFNRNGISVIAAPTDYKCDRGRKYDFFSFTPRMNELYNSWLALHEYVGLLVYRVIYR